MGENSHIEWTDHAFNPWIGCIKVSPGCDNCHAAAWDARWGNGWGPHQRRRTSAANWRKPLARYRDAAAAGTRAGVFCASLADAFDSDGAITSGWRGDLWHLIDHGPDPRVAVLPATLSAQGRRLTRDMLRAHAGRIIRDLPQLRGRDLACWCPLDCPCHADVLIEVANR